MRHLNRVTPIVSVLVSIAAVACAGPSQDANPPNTQNIGSSDPAYGSTMSQPANATPGTGTSAPSATSSTSSVNSMNAPDATSASPNADRSDPLNHEPSTAGTEGSRVPGAISPTGVPNRTEGANGASSDAAPLAGTTTTMGGNAIDVANLSEGQFAAVLDTVNQAEIDAAQLAQTKASSNEVKRFAQRMAAEHRDLQSRAKSLTTRLHITPSENPLSNQLQADGVNEMAALQQVGGTDFDRRYVDAQVRDHNHALELIDRTVQGLKTPEFKAEVTAARARVAEHLRHAEQLQQKLQAHVGTVQGGTGS
jgi:putative membrane protein